MSSIFSVGKLGMSQDIHAEICWWHLWEGTNVGQDLCPGSEGAFVSKRPTGNEESGASPQTVNQVRLRLTGLCVISHSQLLSEMSL